ncbi:MAG: hypothetical protein IBJ00_01265 [Alphaproteobacteria bacterium]|nr:hypothetical protein [Alphaproteobacteria bacterium]
MTFFYEKLNIRFISSLLILCSFLFVILSAQTQAAKVDLKTLGSDEWIRTMMQKYPELEWLLDKSVQHTQEGKAEDFKHSWSYRLKGENFPEFERTILSIVCLYLITDGSLQAYNHFTELQPLQDKLSLASFKHLHEFAQGVLKDVPLETVEINLLLGDMGKTQIARLKAKEFGISEPDHDIFLDACLEECPQIFTTFMALPLEQQEKIKKVAGLVHFGHVTHVEGGPEILTKLKESGILQEDPNGFDLAILTYICDVSAALGHVDNRGSKVLTQDTYKAIEAVKDSIHFLATHDKKEALAMYLSKRAKWLGLNKHTKAYFILARIGAMMLLFSPEEGRALISCYRTLSKTYANIVNNAMDPLILRHERTPTYVPAVLVNLLSTYSKQGMSKTEGIKRCVQDGMRSIAEILEQYRANKTKQPYNPELTINFNKVAGQVRDNPAILKNFTFTIDSEGLVTLNAPS